MGSNTVIYHSQELYNQTHPLTSLSDTKVQKSEKDTEEIKKKIKAWRLHSSVHRLYTDSYKEQHKKMLF